MSDHNDVPTLLRELADEMESQRTIFTNAITLLRQLTAACPWELDAGGGVAFWHAMRQAQKLLREFDEKGNRTVCATNTKP